MSESVLQTRRRWTATAFQDVSTYLPADPAREVSVTSSRRDSYTTVMNPLMGLQEGSGLNTFKHDNPTPCGLPRASSY